MDTIVETKAIEEIETEYIKFSDFYTLVKNEILSNKSISDKFKEYANIKLTIPIREKINDIDYFIENNIKITNICQFQTTNIKHVDLSIRFSLSRGFAALYPNKELSNELQLEEMNERFNNITIGNIFENKIYLDFLDTFIIANYIRTWMWYGRGMEYSSNVYYNYDTRELYSSHINNSVYSVVIEQKQFNIKTTLDYIINAFNTTIKYKEKYLIEEVLMIPITGMHEALILNQNVFDGYKYNNFTDTTYDEINDIFRQICESVQSHYNNNADGLNIEGVKIYSGVLEEICLDKYKVPEITDMVDKLVNIYLDYDKSLIECLDEILKPVFKDEHDLVLMCILVNYPEYATHNFDHLYASACDKGLDQVVRLLISFSKNSGNMLDHNYNKDYGFFWICYKGNLKLARYIYSLGNVNINKTFNGSAFNIACSTNHLELAKWLYTLNNVDIHMNESDGFILSCIRDHEDVYKWMWEMATDKERYFKDWKLSNKFITEYDKYYNILH